MKRLNLSLICFLLASALANAQNKSALSAQILKQLDVISTQDVPKAAPGIATAVIKNGAVIYEKCAGFANLNDSTLITPQTRFNIASNGKQFTALAILKLIDEKKLKLDDDIKKFFPDIFPSISEKIYIKNLLNHTSGIRDVYDLWSLQGITWWENSFSNKDVIDIIRKQQELNFKPGTKYSYSNTNYILLAEIVAKVSGKSFIGYTDDLFRKLNMPNTSFENDYSKIKGTIAKAYFNFDTWTTYNWIWNVCGDGNIFSTLEDQLHWEKIIQGKSKSGIKKKIIRQTQSLIDDSNKNYGYGLEFGKYKGIEYSFHEGATGACKATVVGFPKDNISIVTLTNTGKSIPASQTRQMADLILNLKPDENFFLTKPEKVGSFVNEEEILGTYQDTNDFTFQFIKIGNEIFLRRSGRNDIEIERESANVFHQVNDPDFKQEFKLNSKNEMLVTAYYTSHPPYTLTRANVNWAGFDYNLPDGKFLNSETGVVLEISKGIPKNTIVNPALVSSLEITL